MSKVTRVMKASPEQVWDVLSDGWLYPLWVVGASRMREVDENWPETGARLHHSAGTWPLLIDDTTSVREVRPRSMLSLKARGWPAGEAGVVLTLEPHADGTSVTIEEDVESGPGVLVPKPVRTPMLTWRNVEAMRRLAYLVERRAS
jgi:uncharacterized protein YndB with AHSA1/START domain